MWSSPLNFYSTYSLQDLWRTIAWCVFWQLKVLSVGRRVKRQAQKYAGIALSIIGSFLFSLEHKAGIINIIIWGVITWLNMLAKLMTRNLLTRKMASSSRILPVLSILVVTVLTITTRISFTQLTSLVPRPIPSFKLKSWECWEWAWERG